ncbi:MAG: hypothetical protein QW567_04760 [Candidatus Hadarchaeales archaeon]
MVLVAKIFEVKEPLDMNTAARKLKHFREEEPRQVGGKETKLTTEIIDLKMEAGALSGVFSKDFVLSRYYRRGLVETVVTEEVPFIFRRSEKRSFLIVLAPSKARGVKKLLTNYVANRLSEILFIKTGAIVEARIKHETLKTLHESNPRATKLIWFDNVDIPDIGKLALAGSGLADTNLYHEYLKHGQIWYVVFEVQRRGMTVGITRNCVVTLFTRVEVKEFLTYIMDEVLPLIS